MRKMLGVSCAETASYPFSLLEVKDMLMLMSLQRNFLSLGGGITQSTGMVSPICNEDENLKSK